MLAAARPERLFAASARIAAMTSVSPGGVNGDLKQLLQDRIAQLESGEAEPPKTAEEKAADEGLEGASAALRAVASDTSLSLDEKLRLLQSMHSDCMTDVRALDFEVSAEEKKLNLTELDYAELSEDLRRVENLTEKLKSLSRELSRQNKSIHEESIRRTAEERERREGIVAKFNAALGDISEKLAQQSEAGNDYDDVPELLNQLSEIEEQYQEQEKAYEKEHEAELEKEETKEGDTDEVIEQIEAMRVADEEAIVAEKKIIRELEQTAQRLRKRADVSTEQLSDVEKQVRDHHVELEKFGLGLEKTKKHNDDLLRAKGELVKEEKRLKAKSAEASSNTRMLESELEYWKGKSKTELEKRDTLERLCRTLTEERTVMQKEVQDMQAAWSLLEAEIHKLQSEMTMDGEDKPT